MKKHSFASALLLSTGLSCLALAACTGESGTGGVAATSTGTPAETPSTVKSSAAPSSGKSAAVAPAGGSAARADDAAPVAATPQSQVAAEGAPIPSQDPANQRGGKRYEAGIDRLQSNHDLSKVNVGAESDAHHADDGHDHAANAQDGSSLTPAAQAQTHAGRFELVDGAAQVKDLGKLRQGDVGTFDFPFISGGTEPLVITAVKPSCGCTKAEVALLAEDGTHKPYTKGDPIPVGAKFVLESEINTDGRQGAFNAQITLYGNDARGAFNVRLTADIEPVLTVTPSPTVFFGRITTKERVEQAVTVSATRGEPFLLDFAQEQELDNVTLDFAAKNPDAQGKSNEWEIKVAFGPSTEPGMKSYPIHLQSDLVIENPKYPSQDGSPQYHGFMLNLQAQVVGMVSAEPPFLTFGMVKPGESIDRSLRLECHDEFKLTADIPVIVEGLQGQELPFADRFEITVVPIEDGKAADVKVHLKGLPDDVNGSIGGQMRIKVGHPFMDEVAIRFSAVCRPGLPPTAPPAPPGGQQK